MIHTYPSDAIPGPARVSIDLPDDWQCGPSPELSLIGLAPEQDGRFRPNVNVSHTRVAGTRTIGELAESSRAQLESTLLQFEGPDGDLFGERGGLPAVVREYAFIDPASELALFQVQIQVLCPLAGGVADVVTVTATCAGGQLDRVGELRDVIRSVSVTAP